MNESTYSIALKQPVTYEEMLGQLQNNFKDFNFKIKSGTFEKYIHVKTKNIFVGFNIWYSPSDRTIEVTDTIPFLLFNSTSRDRTRSFTLHYGMRGTGLFHEINRSRRREFKRQLENFILRQF